MNFRTFLLMGVCWLGASLSFAADAPIIIKFSHVVAPETPKGKAADYFKKLAEERTKGKVKVEVYPNSQLYKDGDELDAIRAGNVQMLAPSLSKFTVLGVKDFEVFDLPYMFTDYTDLHRVTQGAIGQRMLKKLEPLGLTGLAFWDNGFKQFHANKPLRTPEDLKGLKMRIQPSAVLESEMQELGATPRTMAFSEVYAGLSSGAIDGAENPISNFYTQKMFEVQKYLTLTDHGYLGYAVVVNKKFWEGLPADIRTQLESAMADATKYETGIAATENQNALDVVKKSTRTQVITLSPEEKAAWKKALKHVHLSL